MYITEPRRKVRFDISGKSWIYNYSGVKLEGPDDAEQWIERELSALARLQEATSGEDKAVIKGPGGKLEVGVYRYIDLFVGDILRAAANAYPEREALISFDGTRRISYEQFYRDASSFAKYLMSVGVKKGEKVSIWMTNGIESVTAMMGIALTGAVFTPFNTYEKIDSMKTLLRETDVNTLILYKGAEYSGSTENIDALLGAFPELKEQEYGSLELEELPLLKRVILAGGGEGYTCPGIRDYDMCVEIGRSLPDDMIDERRKELVLEDNIFIIHTSGSTGRPKGVMLSHRGLVENTLAQCMKMGLTYDDKMCVQVQLFHTFGCVNSTLTSIMMGMPMVLVGLFKPAETLKMIERERCTAVSGVPTMFIGFINAILENPGAYDVSSMRTGTVAGAPCPPKMMVDIEECLHMPEISVCYGLTETSPCVSGTNPGDPLSVKGHTVGTLVPGIEIKFIDPETLEERPHGVPGEICVRGYSLMLGYYKMPEENRKCFIGDGWMRTGDQGHFDEEGYLVIGDRLKDVIIRSGENISPSEIEDVLENHPDIMVAYVVGVKDYKYGEIVGAFVKVRDGSELKPEDLRDYCVGKIGFLKIPTYIWFVEKFPILPNGKISKPELRKIAEATKDSARLDPPPLPVP